MPDASAADQVRDPAITRLLRGNRSLAEKLVGAGETGLTLGTGTLAQLAGGLGGLLAGGTELARTRDFGKAGDAMVDVYNTTSRDATYQPRSQQGRRDVQAIGEVMDPIAKALREHVADPVGKFSPALGAALVAAPEALGAKRPRKPGGKMAEILDTGQAPGIPVSSESGAILPRGGSPERWHIPAEQKPIPRLTDTGQEPRLNQRSQDLLLSYPAHSAVDALIDKGRAINPELEHWYASGPLRDFALNEGLTPAEFERMMAQLSGASQRNPVIKENALGSHLWQLDKSGLLTPEKQLWTKERAKVEGLRQDDPNVITLPYGMGGLAQTSIFNRAKRIAAGERPEDLFGEKLYTYYQNKMGNQEPVTIDVNAMKGPTISGDLTDWLKTLHKPKNAAGEVIGRYTPLKDFKRGKLSLEDAKKNISFWEDAPKTPGEYQAFEDLWRAGSERAGVRPAGGQALGWYGSVDSTALNTPPMIYMKLMEQTARAAAARQGITPIEAFRRAVKGSPGGYLGHADPKLLAALAAGGAGAAGGVALASNLRDRQQQ